jgi:phosphohistidine phosphatase
MKVNFIRHAQAIERSTDLPDEQRNLTCRGRKRFRKVAVSLKKAGIDPDFIITSPKIRAVQTAEILSETLRFNGEVLISPELAGGPDLASLGNLLAAMSEAGELVIVGHEPGLGEVVAQLLQLSTPCHLPKGGVVSLNISFRQSRPTADLICMVTGSGKAISRVSRAMEQLLDK